mmetsp:Transcript_144109/g.461334  ORF Transcript_144109/g.461334 Transcript_144109/m.461334 type:complete len:270 (-) Transcript_144109:1329-2138(-)
MATRQLCVTARNSPKCCQETHSAASATAALGNWADAWPTADLRLFALETTVNAVSLQYTSLPSRTKSARRDASPDENTTSPQDTRSCDAAFEQTCCMARRLLFSYFEKKGCTKITGPTTADASSIDSDSVSKASNSMSRCSKRFLFEVTVCAKYLVMRMVSSPFTLLSRKYHLSTMNCFSDCVAPLKFCKVVIDEVMLLTKLEKTTIAKSNMTTEYVRSAMVPGNTSMDAGVNCVSDQCIEVMYRYSHGNSRKPRRRTQPCNFGCPPSS